jgi:hypothetical protein
VLPPSENWLAIDQTVDNGKSLEKVEGEEEELGGEEVV